MENLAGKRLLIIGGLNNLDDLLELAHRNGIFVGVTDRNPNTYLKKLADAAYDVDATDLDALDRLIRMEHYDGIFSNFTDVLLPYMAQLGKRTMLPVPFNEQQCRLSVDKTYFKQVCRQFDVPVPQEYTLEEAYTLSRFPLIVKPVDSSGSRGISVCHTIDELEAAAQKAAQSSRTQRILLEEYIDGNEINITYIVQNGTVQLAAIHDRYFNEAQPDVLRVPDLYIYPSRYDSLYRETVHPAIQRMIRGLGIQNGSLFFQACVKEDRIVIYEAGMRLNGCKTYQILSVENSYNTMEHLMEFALTGSMGQTIPLSSRFHHWYATVNVLGKPGKKIARIEGMKKLQSQPWVVAIAPLYRENDTIPPHSAGTLLQDTTRIHVKADTKDELIEHIRTVNDTYRLIGTENKDLVLPPHNLEEIWRNLNYDL